MEIFFSKYQRDLYLRVIINNFFTDLCCIKTEKNNQAYSIFLSELFAKCNNIYY